MDIVKHEETLRKQSDSQPKVRVPRMRLWTRLSPMYIFRVFRDTYVRGCVTFGNSSKFNAVSHATAFQISCDDNTFSRSNSRSVQNDIASAQLLLDLSAKFSREILEQESVQSGRKHLPAVITGARGLTMADLQGYASPLRKTDRVSGLKLTDVQGHSGPLRKTGASGLTLNELQGHSGPLRARPSFDAVPESEQYTDTRVSNDTLKIQDRFQTSALHPTDFLQSSSRSDSSYQLGLPPRNSGFAMTRGGSERLPRRPYARYASASSVPHISTSSKPLTPFTDMSTFREQSNGQRKSYDFPRASSRRRERFGSMHASTGTLSGPITPFDDLIRSRSGTAANRPNPYREYDTRLPSPALTV